MDNFLDGFQDIIRFEDICIDNNVFRLHYKITFFLLTGLSTLLLSFEFFGDPIDCVLEGMPMDTIDKYCWIQPTFTVVNQLHAYARPGKDVIEPGVGPFVEGEEEIRYQKYYYWVGIILILQGFIFYIPRLIWKKVEGGRVRMIVENLHLPIYLGNSYDDESKDTVVDYLMTHFHTHTSYAAWFFTCELLNLVNVLGQIYFMDVFFDGQFTTYGGKVFSISEMRPDLRVDPMALMFPKVTKCAFHKYGPSGTIESFDGLCVMKLNVLNEKIYLFLWVWFLFLAVITICSQVYRIATICLPCIRLMILRSKCHLCRLSDVETVFAECKIGDWLILHQLARNINPLVFRDVLEDLSHQLRNKRNT